jgi:fermentation-respiration switch protein FrsA (DUF1100 family)
MAATRVTAPAQKSLFRRFIVGLLVVVAAIYITACVFFYLRQDQMTFPAPASYAKTTPMDAGIPFEDLHIPVNGSDQIHAWWIPATIPSDSSGKVVLAFHGNGYVLEQGINWETVPLHSVGTNLLLIDYRGYGSSSPVTPNEKLVYEDARTAFTYLTVQRRIPSRDIIFLGRSIGTGPATQLATEHPDAGGLILISPFTSTVDVAKSIAYLRLFPLSLLSHNRFDNLGKIASVRIPVFITVGTSDRLTPPIMAQVLFQRANEPKQLYLSPGADHDHTLEIGAKTLVDRISAFIQTLR